MGRLFEAEGTAHRKRHITGGIGQIHEKFNKTLQQ